MDKDETSPGQRALIAGAGRMGTAHARVARQLGFQTVTVDPDRAADYRRLSDAPPADVVVVATPFEHLTDVAHAALDRGCRQLLLEKPMARDTPEALAVLEHAERSGTDVFVDYNERYQPVARLARKELLARVGEVHRLRFERHGPVPAGQLPGSCLDLAVHDIDLVRYFGFSPIAATGHATYARTVGTLECEGVTVSLDVSYRPGPKARGFWIYGSRGVIHGDLVDGVAQIGVDGALEVKRLSYQEPLQNLWCDFVRGEGATGADGLAALALAEMIASDSQAAQTGASTG